MPHAALAPSGQPIWLDMARRSARALVQLHQRGLTTSSILTDAAVRNAMAVYAAFGGSTNLLLHIPAFAHAAGLRHPTVEDWHAINARAPRLVDALPNGPVGHPTVRVFLAGGVPEVMLHLRRLGLLDESCLTAIGEPLGHAILMTHLAAPCALMGLLTFGIARPIVVCMEPTLLDTVVQLFSVLGQLLSQLVELGVHWLLLLIWVAWWLLAVNWQKAWPALRSGGWAPLVLLTIVTALAWSRLQPSACDRLGIPIANFWWQLGYVTMLVALALFCGWLQGVLRWAPPEIRLEPQADAHADDHGHAAHH